MHNFPVQMLDIQIISSEIWSIFSSFIVYQMGRLCGGAPIFLCGWVWVGWGGRVGGGGVGGDGVGWVLVAAQNGGGVVGGVITLSF